MLRVGARWCRCGHAHGALCDRGCWNEIRVELWRICTGWIELEFGDFWREDIYPHALSYPFYLSEILDLLLRPAVVDEKMNGR